MTHNSTTKYIALIGSRIITRQRCKRLGDLKFAPQKIAWEGMGREGKGIGHKTECS